MRWAQKYFVRCGRFSGGHFELYIVTTKKDKHARTVNFHYLIIMRILMDFTYFTALSFWG